MDLQRDIANTEMENKCCENCAYHDDWTWVCFNGGSEMRADVTNNDFVCDKWEDKNGKDNAGY